MGATQHRCYVEKLSEETKLGAVVNKSGLANLLAEHGGQLGKLCEEGCSVRSLQHGRQPGQRGLHLLLHVQQTEHLFWQA